MAKTIQKKVKFSKGQIVPELAERVDLNILDESAQKMKNVVSTVYGGVRSRRGLKYIDKITDLNESTPNEITSDIFLDTSNFSDNTTKTVSRVGNNRVLANLDFGSNENTAAKLTIKNIKINPYVLELKSPAEATYQLPVGKYEVIVVGAGGGSGTSFKNFNKWHGAYGTGGSGAVIVGNALLNAGSYNIKVGSGTIGQYGENVGVGGDGQSSFIAGVVVCNGGTGGAADYDLDKNYNGTGGTYQILNSSLFESFNIKRNGNDGSYGEGAYLWGTWSGGSPAFMNYGGGAEISSALNSRYNAAGDAGYVRLTLLSGTMNVVISGSKEGSTWEEISRESISTSVRDIEIEMSYRYRHIKVELSLDSSYNNCGISFQYIREDISISKGITNSRLIPFVYNNEDRYLLFFSNEKVQIFKDDELLSVLDMPRLKKEFLRSFKAAQKDDTIVLTHPDMKPQIIKRVSTGFESSDLSIENIPTAVFGAEQKEKKKFWIKPTGVEGAIKLKSVKDKDGTEDGEEVFTKDMIGQYIDGNGGKLKITDFISTKEVGGNTVIPFYTDNAFEEWEYISGYEKAWSEERGYPRTCLFASQRLWFGGSKSKPNTIWGSRLGDYFNFKNSGNYDND